MKIIFINRFFYPDHSATSQLLTDLAFHLAGKGRDVSVVCSRQRYDDATAELPASERVNNVQVCRVWTSRFGRQNLIGRGLDYLSFYSSAAWRLFWMARAGDIVVAKTDPPMISVVAGWVARLRGARLVNWLQDLFPEVAVALKVRGFNGWLGRILTVLRNGSLRQAEVNVVLGRLMARRLEAEGVGREKIHIIHNWSDGESIGPVAAGTNELRAAWGLNGKFVVGYSGNVGRAHEFETLLNAAERLRGETDICFLLIGDGARLERVKAEIIKRGLSNFSCQPYQPRENLGQSLGVADIHIVVLRPELEGLIVPSKFYGIAAAGRPTVYIGDEDGEVPSILAGNEAGLTVPIGDDERLAAEILGLSHDPERCERMGANARMLFERSYDRRHAMLSWEQILTGLCSLQ